MTFLSLCRLSRQVCDLKTSVKEIASRLDLIMTRLQLHDEIKAREATKQLAATKSVCMECVVSNYEPNSDCFLTNQQQNSCSSTSVMPSLKLTVFPSWTLLSRELNLPLMGASWLLWTAAGPRCRRVYPFTAAPHTALVCEKHVHRLLTKLADT